MTDNQDWIGLYRGNTDLATPESNAHPAKASFGLAFKIIEHLEEMGLLRPGDTVADFMAGTGRFLLAACAKGYRAVGVELEEKFVGFIKDNKEYAEKRLGHPIDLTIIQGDSRRLSELLTERGVIEIMSPPYMENQKGGGGVVDNNRQVMRNSFASKDTPKAIGYGTTRGQIGNMAEGKVIVTSPPYEGAENRGTGGIDWEKAGRLDRTIPSDNRRNVEGINPGGYGETTNQIGQEQGVNYWSAMKQVYAESLKVADVMVLVTKDPTRKGKIHPLGQMTADLITEIGWRIVDWHKAILYDTQEQGGLFGNNNKKLYKGRISFFKRLGLQKGNVAADHEDVMFAVNPNGRRSGVCEITSPPFGEAQTGGGIAVKGYQGPHINEMGKNQPDKVGQRCGYMKSEHGSNPANIGNLKEK